MPATIVAAADPGLPFSRARIERIIDNLVALLDATEPDPDLEPSLGYNPYGCNDAESDEADNEPWLGWTSTMAYANREDLEEGDDNGIADAEGASEQGWLGTYLVGGGWVE